MLVASAFLLAAFQPPSDIPPLAGVNVVPPAHAQPKGWLHGPSNVGTNLRLNRDTTTASQNEFGIAVDPTDPMHFVAGANDYRTGPPRVGFYVSFDGGRTVANDGVVPNVGTYAESGDPAVAFDGNGNLYVMALHFRRSPTEGGIYLHPSTDGGRTFGTPLPVIDVARNLPDKPYIAIDQRTSGTFAGSIYVTFTGFNAAPTGLRCTHSRDGGRTWSAAVSIGTGQGTSPAVGPNGEVYIAWQAGNAIQFNRSFDGGQTFSGARTIRSISRNPSPLPPTRFRCNSFPSTAVDNTAGPYAGRVYVCWSSRGSSGSDIFLTRSDDRGATWSTPVQVDGATSGDQYFQWLTVDDRGVVWASWHDRRNDPANTMHDCYAAASYDGGQTWQEWRATDRMSNPGSTGFLGDYNGIAAASGRAYPTWVDTRNGDQDIYTAPVQADLEFSPIDLSAATGGTITMSVKAGPLHQGQNYVMVANFTGVNPVGFPIGQGRFYLNLDPLVEVSLFLGNTVPFVNFQGVLGPGGIAARSPQLQLAPGFWTPFVGTDTSMAYLVLDPTTPAVTYGSNPVSVRIKP